MNAVRSSDGDDQGIPTPPPLRIHGPATVAHEGSPAPAPRRLQGPKPLFASALLVLDSVLVALIIAYVPRSLLTLSLPVDGFLGGERDCTKLKGDTGPLVYPAGFLYVYSAIKFLTGGEFRTENCPM
ncbi:hypothetical protein BHM03_00022715 [Ensete ventricosum]|nr:hypothetical protein BHM03_00022715 [Ensete ventricosum]